MSKRFCVAPQVERADVTELMSASNFEISAKAVLDAVPKVELVQLKDEEVTLIWSLAATELAPT